MAELTIENAEKGGLVITMSQQLSWPVGVVTWSVTIPDGNKLSILSLQAQATALAARELTSHAEALKLANDRQSQEG